ncbi:hypothetical protein [Methanosphaerula subterraneus]|uniref:hypothetical protein n=1 Tax=Methanosphaerula subterraneus TaxID=3350244 RepID=UPI003F83AC23
MDAGSEIGQGLAVLVAPGQVFEVRSWTGDRISSGYFDDLTAAEKAIEALDAAGPDGIYLTPNPVLPDLLSRRANRIKGPLAKKDSSTSDGDIIGRRWLLVDIDPARPAGVSSSEEEHAATLTRAADIAAALGERGWPAPVAGDSGNGAHLLYRLDLPNDDQVTALIKAALVALDALFSDPVASVDTAVFNASRIWKVYGTVARKGDNTATRPHRRSRLLSVPETIEIVTREQLAALAIADPAGPAPVTPATSTSRGTGRRPGEPLDLAGWLRDHGLGVLDSRPYQGGDLYRLDSCPFSSTHTDGAFAIQFGSGAVYAGCHHASCGGGSQRWPELREMYEGTRQGTGTCKPASSKSSRSASPVTPAQPAPSEEILREAEQILMHGDPLAYMVRTYNLDHIGDQVLGRCLALSLASRLVSNSHGLHIMTTGESGKGKSDGYRAMLAQVPQRFRMAGSFSDKSLYYMDDLQPQTVLMIDDKDLSDGLQEILKEATSSFTTPIEHRTLTTERKPLVCTIPERCLWWVAKKEGSGDDQVLNRMLMVWVDESEEQDRAVLAGILAKEAIDSDQPAGERHEVAVCRAMWEQLHAALPTGLAEVNLSRFSRRIRFSSARNRRNPIILFDLIRSAALLNFYQRERRTFDGGAVRVYATEADFKTAAGIFTSLNGRTGSQDDKLTARESQMLDVINRAGLTEFTVMKLQALTKLSNYQISRLFVGYFSRGAKYSGLLEKCPAVGAIEQTISSRNDDGEGTIRRRVVAFTFDRELYASWIRGGLVWLAPIDEADPSPDNDPPDGLQQLQQYCSSTAAGAATPAEPAPAVKIGSTSISQSVHEEIIGIAADLDNREPPQTATVPDPSLSLVVRDLLQPPDRNPQTASETTNRPRMNPERVAAPAALLLHPCCNLRLLLQSPQRQPPRPG